MSNWFRTCQRRWGTHRSQRGRLKQGAPEEPRMSDFMRRIVGAAIKKSTPLGETKRDEMQKGPPKKQAAAEKGFK